MNTQDYIFLGTCTFTAIAIVIETAVAKRNTSRDKGNTMSSPSFVDLAISDDVINKLMVLYPHKKHLINIRYTNYKEAICMSSHYRKIPPTIHKEFIADLVIELTTGIV